MKKLNKTSELMWVLGVLLVSLGVCICKKADLGVSMIAAPTFIVQEALVKLWDGFTPGTVEYILQGVTLAVVCLICLRFDWRYLLAFVVAVIYGYSLDLWLLIFGPEAFDSVALRWVMLIVGDATVSLGVAAFFRTYLPLEVPELAVAILAGRFKVKINKMKMIYDYSMLTLSIILSIVLFMDFKEFNWADIWKTSFHSIGVGTIVTTIINSPMIAGFGKLFDMTCNYEPLFPKLKTVLERKDK